MSDTRIFDFDDHDDEAEDAFTRHQDRSLRNRGVRRADIDGHRHVTDLVDHVRVDRLLLGSDWPHAEGTREPVEFVTDTLAGLPADAVRRVSRDNALDLLGVSVA